MMADETRRQQADCAAGVSRCDTGRDMTATVKLGIEHLCEDRAARRTSIDRQGSRGSSDPDGRTESPSTH